MVTKTEQDRFQDLETLLDEARAEADGLRHELQRLQNVLVSTRLIMGHELKKPTTAISGYLDLALEDLDEVGAAGEVTDSLHKARKECHLLNELNLFFIKLFKFDDVESSVGASGVNVAELVNEVVCHVPATLNAHDRMSVNADHDAAEFRVDKNALKIILGNLIENALSYTRNAVTVDIERSRDKRGFGSGDLLKVRVSDRGKGIPESYLQRIFSPFVRLPNSDDSEGSGLGLTLVRSLVDLCDGSVYVDSGNGDGMTVHVTLPEQAERPPAAE